MQQNIKELFTYFFFFMMERANIYQIIVLLYSTQYSSQTLTKAILQCQKP